MSLYARNTQVSVERSEAEIKKTLVRYGGDNVILGTSRALRQAAVEFKFKERSYRVAITLPDHGSQEFHRTGTGRARVREAATRDYDRACRQKWRVLALLLKAQLEAVQEGILAPEDAFMSWLMLPNGQTIGEATKPHLDKLLAGQTVAKALPFFAAEKEGAKP
jgi:hypothetical protein